LLLDVMKKCVATFETESVRFLVRNSAKGYALFYFREENL